MPVKLNPKNPKGKVLCMSSAPTAPQSSTTLYATLTGSVDQAMVQRVFQSMALAIGNGVKSVHVLFHSAGGTVGDGVALYNYLRTLPIDLHLYNGGSVASVAVISFLGAKHRYTSASATFMIHRTYAPAALFTSAAAANAARLRGVTQSIEIDDARTLAILKANLTLTDQRLDEYLTTELPFDAKAALQCGLVRSIQEFTPPLGETLFNI
jgi:ATP-dependent Clp protease, protease subunit